jgi:hypothetical protein
MTKIEYSLRPATGADVPKVAALVNDAYGHYVERIGILPRPEEAAYSKRSVWGNTRRLVARSSRRPMRWPRSSGWPIDSPNQKVPTSRNSPDPKPKRWSIKSGL